MNPQTINQSESLTSSLDQKGFESVSLKHLSILNVVTLGAYQVYWLYKASKALHERGRTKILPELCLIGLLMPALNPLVCYAIFKSLNLINVSLRQKTNSSFSPLASAVILTISNCMLLLNLWQGATYRDPSHHAALVFASIIFYLVLSTGVLWSQQKILNRLFEQY